MAVTVIEHITITTDGVEWTYTTEDGRPYDILKGEVIDAPATTLEVARIAAKRALREFH